MSNRNWECGVIVPVTQSDGQKQESAAADEASTPDMDIFADVVPVPMSTPALLLTADNPPWYFGELRGNPFSELFMQQPGLVVTKIMQAKGSIQELK
ncbi:hypothetical protein ABW21_db0202289 [Orbilia brochopaga]|nr:hypothetical protein ABW21_db0202289 [Drechslerella brochopaga]